MTEALEIEHEDGSVTTAERITMQFDNPETGRRTARILVRTSNGKTHSFPAKMTPRGWEAVVEGDTKLNTPDIDRTGRQPGDRIGG